MPKQMAGRSTRAQTRTTSRSKPASKPTRSRSAVRSSRAPAERRSKSKARRTAEPGASVELNLFGWWQKLSAERRMDLVGVVLALVGLLSLLALLSKEHGAPTGWWVNAFRQIGGDGALILPAALLILGGWLVLRKVERIPAPSGERVTGLILLYGNLLGIIHLAAGGGWELAEVGQGGGYVGAAIERTLVAALGKSGTWVILMAWFLVAILLTLDISLPDLIKWIVGLVQRLVDRWQGEQALVEERAAARSQQVSRTQPSRTPALSHSKGHSAEVEEEEAELPGDFTPIPGAAVSRGGGRTAASGRAAQRSDQPAGSRAVPTGEPVTTPVEQVSGAAVGPVWVLPSAAEILDPPTIESVKSNVEQERARLIEETLTSFGAPAHVVEIHHGPTVTQYGVEPDFIESRTGRMRVRVSKIVSLADDLALALAAQRIRIQAPVPGRSYVGIEVPNTEVSRVMVREVMESEGFQKLRSPLRFAIGKDVSGKPISYDLTGMPHLLIAGTTGAGKSVCVNALLTCLLMQNTPVDLKMILVDPKRVELTGYNGIPHLLAPVVVEPERVVGALQWVQREMDARYHRFSQVGARNIAEYNRKNSPRLPYLLVLVDELADLMMLAPDETERNLTRLAQLARATGIHLVLATQRPSVDVVTGLIKANFPSRIAFAVASGIDSRVILDQPGAERLLGRGDMLFQAPDAPAPVRLQGVYVSDQEIQRLVDYWKIQSYNLRSGQYAPPADGTAEPVNMDLPLGTPLTQTPLFDSELGSKGGDPMLDEAIKLVRLEGKASISMLQRKLHIGYTRAARLIDSMEDKGIVGPAQAASQVRQILDPGDIEEE